MAAKGLVGREHTKRRDAGQREEPQLGGKEEEDSTRFRHAPQVVAL